MNTEIPRHLILVIGAGPAGLYAAGKFAETGSEVILLNRDIKPGGLAEYGIYFNKHKMKEGIRKQFRKILSDPRIHYFGHVRVGESADFTLPEIRDLVRPSATFITTGAQGTKFLGVQGEHATGVYHAKDLVYHYNDLPPFSERDFPMGKKIAIIGIGNVMVDIAHYLIHVRKVDEVVAIARRGPFQRAYSDLEIKNVAANFDLPALRQELERVGPRLGVPDLDSEALFKELTKYSNAPAKEGESPTRLVFRYMSNPHEILLDASGRARGVKVEDGQMIPRNGDLSLRGLGTYDEIGADNVVFAVGDRVDETLGLPVKGSEYVTNPQPDPDFPGDENYQAYDPAKGEPLEGVFVAGWSRKASDGLVGKAKQDGERGVTAVLHMLEKTGKAEAVDVQERLAGFKAALTGRNVQHVQYAEVQQLEELERKIAAERGLEFFKFSTDTEMLDGIALGPHASIVL